MSQEQGPEESAVADFLQILEEHRKNCERQGKYVEAEIAKNRLEELKMHEENRRKEAMRSRQVGMHADTQIQMGCRWMQIYVDRADASVGVVWMR